MAIKSGKLVEGRGWWRNRNDFYHLSGTLMFIIAAFPAALFLRPHRARRDGYSGGKSCFPMQGRGPLFFGGRMGQPHSQLGAYQLEPVLICSETLGCEQCHSTFSLFF